MTLIMIGTPTKGPLILEIPNEAYVRPVLDNEPAPGPELFSKCMEEGEQDLNRTLRSAKYYPLGLLSTTETRMRAPHISGTIY